MRSLWPCLVALLALSLQACAALQASTAEAWTLLHHADAEGRQVAGSLDRLHAAIERGAPLRLRWRITWTNKDGTPGAIEHLADAGFITVFGDEIWAQVEAIHRQIPDPKTHQVALDGKERWTALISSRGELRGTFIERGMAHEQKEETWWYAPGR